MKVSFTLPAVETLPEERKKIAILALVEALVVIDTIYLMSNKVALADVLRDGRVKLRHYSLESIEWAKLASEEDAWLDIPAILNAGSGNARDLACWRIAELRNRGEHDVGAYIRVSSPSPQTNVYEVLVRRGRRLEDPRTSIEGIEGVGETWAAT